MFLSYDETCPVLENRIRLLLSFSTKILSTLFEWRNE